MDAPTRLQAHRVFAALDAMDVSTLTALFAEDAQVVFGNGQPFVGIDEIRSGTTAFLGTIAGLHHTIVQEWVCVQNAYKLASRPRMRS